MIYTIIENQNYDYIIINGYTDDSGPEAYNLKLSKRRAESVMSILAKLGIDVNKMQAAGHGNSNPEDFVNKANNRRVEIIVE